MTIAVREPKLTAFLEALPNAEPNSWCSPPGLGGVWRVRIMRTGLEKGIITVHRSGRGLAFAPFPSSHGACSHCVSKRAVCDHCSCPHCAFDRMSAETAGRPVSRAQVDALRERLRNFRMAKAPTVTLDD